MEMGKGEECNGTGVVETKISPPEASGCTDGSESTLDWENAVKEASRNLVAATQSAPSTSSPPNAEIIDVLFPWMLPVESLVDVLQSTNLSDNRRETNVVNEQHHHHHHHHESLSVENVENSSPSEYQSNNSNDVLDEYCLFEIFSYLSLNDMIQVKKVSKMWYQVSQRWFKKVQTLVYSEEDIGENKLEVYEKYYKRKIYEKTGIHGVNDLIKILLSCGHHIKYYKANFYLEKKKLLEEYKQFIFQWVPKLCKNIVDVHINGRQDLNTPSTFMFMATHWRKLETINIKYLPRSVGKNFHKLLHNNKQLKTLRIQFTYNPKCPVNDKFFTYLPATISEISIGNMGQDKLIKLSHFISTSKNFTSLQSLELSGFRYLSNAVATAIANITSLTHLSLNHVHRYESCRTINLIAKLKGLKSLDFSYCYNIYEDSFINVVESCTQLKALHILDMYPITRRGLAAIAKKKKLKCAVFKSSMILSSECD